MTQSETPTMTTLSFNSLDKTNLSLMFNYDQKKSENGAINKIRENLFVLHMNQSTSHSIIDPIKAALASKGLKFITCISKGGMTNSYDFVFNCEDNVVCNVELKVLTSFKLPQLTDVYISCSNEIIVNQFELFTTEWIKILEKVRTDFNISTAMPNLTEVQDNICKPGKSNCMFLQDLKKKLDIKGPVINQADLNKADIIMAKISPLSSEEQKFMENFSKNFTARLNLESRKFGSKFLDANFNKVSKANILSLYESKLNCKDLLVIYNKKTQTTKCKFNDKKFKLDISEIKLKKCKNNKYNIGILVTFKITKGTDITTEDVVIRLRWKNRNGLYGPAWKLDPITKLT